jgi:peroxiredoxin
MNIDDYADDYENWKIKDHLKRTDKRIGELVPSVKFKIRVRDDSIEGPNPYRWDDLNSYEIFGGKRVIVFALPGAFTPTCSTYQLPNFEKMYDDFKARGVDEIYCLSVNDAFVMNCWAKQQGVEKVKMLPDGNADFTSKIGMLVEKSNLGFGERSWRYAMIVDNGKIRGWFEEPGFADNAIDDPYGESSPENVIKYLDVKS